MNIKLFIFIILFLVLSTTKASAFVKSSAYLATTEGSRANDDRVKTLKAYLEENNSPLASSAQVFVDSADEYNIDWKLVAAISGVESTFGQAIPPASYNAWGWGVYGDNVIYFSSWDDGIKTISQGIRERYMNERGATNVYEIGSTYATSTTWAQRVEMYMQRIDDYTALNTSDGLSISL
ncbi:MAG: hypothetical protein AAB895_04050 [Patescibacteria group bacterium]